jgi:hypothetical protein
MARLKSHSENSQAHDSNCIRGPYGSGILCYKRVRRQQRDAFRGRLCNKNTIEGIHMKRRQALESDNVITDDRQFVIAIVEKTATQ